MRASPSELSRVELCIGDSVRFDDQILTVLDISEDEVTFRVDAVEVTELDNLETENFASGNAVCYGDEGSRFPPR
jgi:riboflavin synthase alpha subunit